MRVGVASGTINPNTLVELAGYGYHLGRTSVGVRDDLTTTVLAIEGDDGTRAALCGVDLLSVDSTVVEGVRREMSRLSNGELDSTSIMLCASHTHSGPLGRRNMHGVGKYNPEYIDNVLVPRVARTIVGAFRQASDGEIGIDRAAVQENLAYNRTGGTTFDPRVTALRVENERQTLAGAHFACHPVVYGKTARLVSGDFPEEARRTLSERLKPNATQWLTGCAGDIDPTARRDRGDKTTSQDAELLGRTLGHHAADLYGGIVLGQGHVRTIETTVQLPVNTSFELVTQEELEAYREARRLPRTQDLSMLEGWLNGVAPIVNGNTAEMVAVPVSGLAIGRLVFVGIGAEAYSATGLAIEDAHPDLRVVITMNTNEHEGYIPVASEYANNSYGVRSSAFIFGRKPLTPDSESVLQAGVKSAISQLIAA